MATAILFYACEKLFHEEELSITKITSYEQLLEATQGVYGQLAYSFFYNLSNYEQGCLSYFLPNIKGDDLYQSNFGTQLYSIYWVDISAHCEDFIGPEYFYNYQYSDDIYYTWQSMYKILGSLNNIITQFDYKAIDDKSILKIMGELHFIRAYCYFRLTRTYGQIPIVKDRDIKYDIKKSTYEEIYQFIESDLKISIELLPANNSEARESFITPHVGTAKALLSEVYLSWAGYPCKDIAKYTLAAQYSAEVIENKASYGFDIIDDFAELWLNNNLYNNENVFAIYRQPDEYFIINEMYHGYYFAGEFYGGGNILLPDRSIDPYYYPVERKFFNTYPVSYRKDITFYNTIYVPHGYQYEYEGIDSNIDTLETYINPVEPHLTPAGNLTSVDTCYLIHFNKVHSPCDLVSYRKFFYDLYSNHGSDIGIFNGLNKIYVIRFAQTLLTYAEAKARSGEIDQLAYECINTIRRRAHNLDLNTPSPYDLQPGLSPEAFADSVVWERAWELAGELEGRWFDLVRLEMVEELPNLKYPDVNTYPPNVYDKSEYFFPAPPEDILLNSYMDQ